MMYELAFGLARTLFSNPPSLPPSLPHPPGLPASSLALDELRVYWTNGTSGIFAVAFSDNTSVIEISPTTTTASSVVSLSPGQQPLPCEWMCDFIVQVYAQGPAV